MPQGHKEETERKNRIIEAHLKQKVPVSTLSSGYGMSTKTIWRWIKEYKLAEEEKSVNLDEATV